MPGHYKAIRARPISLAYVRAVAQVIFSHLLTGAVALTGILRYELKSWERIMNSRLLTILAMAFPVLAQTSVKDALVKHATTSGEFTVAIASSMPTESYNFRPDPEEMTFGQLIRHIAAVNLDACANASGMTRPTLSAKMA